VDGLAAVIPLLGVEVIVGGVVLDDGSDDVVDVRELVAALPGVLRFVGWA
jgi:hypothetical protein